MGIVRSIPVFPGGSRAGLIFADGDSFDSSGGFITSGHSDVNNLLSGPFGFAAACTIEALIQTGSRFDFGFKHVGADGDISVGAGDDVLIIAAIITDEDPSSIPDLANSAILATCPLSVEWRFDVDGLDGSVQTIWRSFGTEVRRREDIDPGFGNVDLGHGSPEAGRPGPRYTILLSGTEYRGYLDYVPNGGQKPEAIVAGPSAGYPFPLRLAMTITQPNLCVKHVMVAGARPGTIYSKRDQIEDFGEEQTELHYKVYQTSPMPGITGVPTYVSIYSDGTSYQGLTPDDWPGWET